jgi:hypothetical protein
VTCYLLVAFGVWICGPDPHDHMGCDECVGGRT